MTIKPWTAGHCYYDGDVVMHEGKRYRQRDGYGGVTPSSVPPGSPEWHVSTARWEVLTDRGDWANVPMTATEVNIRREYDDKISRLERRVNDLEAGLAPSWGAEYVTPEPAVNSLPSWGAEWEDSWPKVRAEVRRLENLVKFHRARAAKFKKLLTGEDE